MDRWRSNTGLIDGLVAPPLLTVAAGFGGEHGAENEEGRDVSCAEVVFAVTDDVSATASNLVVIN